MKRLCIYPLLPIFPVALAISGCMPGKEYSFPFAGVTDTGVQFKFVNYHEYKLGGDKLWGLGVSNTLQLWIEFPRDAVGSGICDLVREDVFDKLDFIVRTDGNRIWLVDRQANTVLAAADLDTGVCYPEWGDQPDWALPGAGTVVQDTRVDRPEG